MQKNGQSFARTNFLLKEKTDMKTSEMGKEKWNKPHKTKANMEDGLNKEGRIFREWNEISRRKAKGGRK